MNCMNCGAFLTDMDLDYCSHCGCNVLIQKKVDYLSKYFYNQGLEKASIRDLSGAITCLKQSLTYNKGNIQARNLLGLVYFETGEVVAALSEWVISKNLQPNKNLASGYIDKLQANANKLEAINETIKKYNHALALCREGHEDMAAIQLKKILTQNSKLIKGYHLLALIQMKDQEWNKARRILKKAARIDKTNTTTLRFLREVDEQTGVTTRLEQQGKGFFRGSGDSRDEDGSVSSDLVIQPPAYKERSKVSLFFTLMLGFAAGAAAFLLLAVPAIRQGIYREANQQIVKYSESLASQGAELSKAQDQAQETGDTVEAAAQQIAEEKKRSESYEALLKAYSAMQQENIDEAALEIQKVYADVIPDSLKGIYTTVCNNTGVTGIEGDGNAGGDDGNSDGGGDNGGYDDCSGFDDGGGDNGGYDDGSGGDGGYDDGSGDSDGYDDSGYEDDGYEDGY
ncbi:MAG: hypothetical protein Q4D16_23125 [Eubacteriales bacterium]|nr:hypothetical protein [Eubacteriales bacterium]